MSSSVPYDPYIPNQTTGDQSNSRTAAIQAVSINDFFFCQMEVLEIKTNMFVAN